MPILTLYRRVCGETLDEVDVIHETFLLEGYRSPYVPWKRTQALMNIAHHPEHSIPTVSHHFVGEAGRYPAVGKVTYKALAGLAWKSLPEDAVPAAIRADGNAQPGKEQTMVSWYVAKVDSIKLKLLPGIDGTEESPAPVVPDLSKVYAAVLY